MKILFTLLTGLLFGFLVSCNSGNKEPKHAEKTTDQSLKGKGILIADPIIYDVVVLNPDPEDRWTSEKLEKLNKEDLVDLIFQAIEEGKVTAYNYHTEEKMSMKDIRTLEKTEEFNKSKIGKIQFVENWYFDEKNMKMTKVVKSIMLAYEVYDQFGKVRGYKAAFRIDLN
jgi:hypothetical protein